VRALVLAGATATGKTAVAEWIAARFPCEVVCADSRQVFRGLDVGTGKPSPDELARVPHRLFDALELGERASAGWWARAAAAACREAFAAGRTPLLVGGSGLYLRALLHGLAEEPPHDPERRTRLAAEARERGTPALHARLAALDSAAAARLHPGDTQRVTRALEIVEASGRPLAWWRARHAAPELDATWCVAELTLPVATLDARIAERTRAMFDAGLAEETRGLVEAGKEAALRALRAVGYDEALELNAGTLARDAAEARTTRRTRQLAKRQRTWFRHQLDALRVDGRGRVPELGAALVEAFAMRAGRVPS
jgi:tRNA dimethylallyltransferase